MTFRCDPDADGITQQCTYCGAAGSWTEWNFRGYYAAPSGHTLRQDGTLGCPRSLGDRLEGKDWEWEGRTATVEVIR